MSSSAVHPELCWFCQTNFANPNSAYLVKMYGNVERTGAWSSKLTWKNMTVKVPRCKRCQRWNGLMNKFMKIWIIIFVVAFLLLVMLMADWYFWVGSFVVWLGVVILGILILAKHASPLNPERTKKAQRILCEEYPLVCAFLENGWKIGSGPSG